MLHSGFVLSTPAPRRLAVLDVAPECLLGLLHYLNEDGRRITQTGIPADATVVAADYDFEHRCFRLLLASDEFELVASGSVAPNLYAILTEHRGAV